MCHLKKYEACTVHLKTMYNKKYTNWLFYPYSALQRMLHSTALNLYFCK